AAPAPTLIALGCLTAAYGACAAVSRLACVGTAAAVLAVLCAAALAECVVLAADRGARRRLPGLAGGTGRARSGRGGTSRRDAAMACLAGLQPAWTCETRPGQTAARPGPARGVAWHAAARARRRGSWLAGGSRRARAVPSPAGTGRHRARDLGIDMC